jgi:tRNA A37 N6-isopentenylltransferase MiaA
MIISGPTAMGKSKLAFKLAKEIDGEVIVADSVKVRWIAPLIRVH